MIVYAKEHGIVPGMEIGKQLNELIASLKNDEAAELVLEKGEYFIDADNCPIRYYHITNTIGEKEYEPGEEMWKKSVALLFEGKKDLTFDGSGSVITIDGIVDNVVFDECENVTLKNLELKFNKPNVHKLTTVKRSLTSITLQVDEKEEVVTEKGEIYFVGKGYKHPLMYHSAQPYFNSALPGRPTYFTRIFHPLLCTGKITYENGFIRAKGFFPARRFAIGQEYFIYDNRRKNVGVFAQKCKNLTLNNFTQRLSMSLAVVCQDCENLTFEKLNLSPEDYKKFGFCSVADFLHLCCCRGQITVRDSFFSSSGDDVLNVHGIHFIIKKTEGDTATVKFCHSQAYGFNIFHPGDEIAVIDKNSLLQQTTRTVLSAEMIDLYTIKLTLNKPLESSYCEQAIENLAACPDVLFENNRFERISTRGLLVTTRGKVIIRNNDFTFTKMWAIEVADDARDWFESGMVTDLTVENNRFNECTQEYVHIFPHNLIHKGYVHNNVTIRNNQFNLKKRICYIVRSCGNVHITGNTYVAPKRYRKYMLKLNAGIVEKDF